MIPKICTSVIGQTSDEVMSMIRQAEENGANLIEIRLDYFREPVDLHKIRSTSDILLIATNRPSSESGLFEGTEEERFKMLLNASQAQFNMIDIELDTTNIKEKIQSFKGVGAKVIVSSHTSDRPTSKWLEHTYNRQRRLEPDICKIVPSAETVRDNLTCLNFISQASTISELVCFCMGSAGRISRILSPLLGCAYTYGSLSSGKESASGQLTIADMREIYRLLGV